jgi:transposase
LGQQEVNMNEEEISIYTIAALPAVQDTSCGISKDGGPGAVSDIGNGVLEGKTIMVPYPIVDLERKAPLITLEDWTSIRWLHFREKRSIRWIAKEFKISRKTIAKYLDEPDAPRYNLSQSRAKPVADQWRTRVEEILESDKSAPRKQRHTARRIYCRLVDEAGYLGSERTIRQVVADLKNKPAAKASVPLVFESGRDAQVDFGESYADIAGERVKLHGFEMRLNYSRKKFIQFFPSTDKEAFLEGHVRAFAYFRGVVARLSYDNLSAGVAQVKKGKERILTKEFKELKGYYNFETNFCQPGIEGAHEKGGVEGGIGFSRRNWMVPVPAFETLKQLNDYILQKCLEDEERIVDGEAQTIGEAWRKEQPTLLPLPVRPFDPAVNHGGLVDNYCTVALKESHYSVPAKYVGKGLTIRAYWNRVQISDGLQIVAEHPRTYKKDEYILRAEHYLDLLEKRPHAVPYARPLLQQSWPKGYWEFYQKMVAAIGPGQAGRDFIRILKSHVKYGGELVGKAIEESAQFGSASADVVIAKIDQARLTTVVPEITDLDSYPQLADIRVTVWPLPEQYQALLVAEGGVGNDDECVA